MQAKKSPKQVLKIASFKKVVELEDVMSNFIIIYINIYINPFKCLFKLQ